MNWSEQQVLSFAPDTGTAKRGQALATMRKWLSIATDGRAIWGECKGSGRKPYLSKIDVQGPAFKCTCPSRKFPCKHTIGLMLLYARGGDGFSVQERPETVNTWLASRDKRLSKPAEKPKAAQEKAATLKATNADKRILAMKAGLEDLEIWMNDIIRQGLAAIEKNAYTLCEDIARRMVDAKLRGIANRIKEIPLLIGANANWIEEVLSQLGEIYLFAQGFKKLETLPANFQAELKMIGGINVKKEELLTQNGIRDTWLILGKKEGKDPINESLAFRRVWLLGKRTKRPALVLDFAFGGAGFQNHFALGMEFKGELIYYPGTYPLRAIVKRQQPATTEITDFTRATTIQQFMEQYTVAVAGNPWLLDFPAVLSEVTPIMDKEQLYVVDKEQHQIPVLDKKLMGWKLLALSGGTPISIFGEWTGDILVPLSACVNGRFVELTN